ncbi:MAG: HDOD domain-containing protein [Azoarcus sp.]|jgi:HD-like signal output (HDOD) protein|nr:HDOD domain-containing protein [Azoarcus sp.]
MHSAQELIDNIESLTMLPSVYYRIREQLDSPDGSIGTIAHLVETDPALTSKVLKLVNSALFGFSRKIESISRAISILGLQQTHELVLAMSVSAVFDGIQPRRMDMKRFWQGSMMTALTARELAHATCSPASERLFVIGLLADIGHLVMYQSVPGQAIEAQISAGGGRETLPEAERRIIGCDSAEVGAALMDSWKLPPNFAEIIGAQIDPPRAGSHVFEAELLHVALAMSAADRYNESSAQALSRIDPDIWTDIGIAAEHFPRIREAAEMHLSTCIAMFFPRLEPAR